jgi:hypothetical protein
VFSQHWSPKPTSSPVAHGLLVVAEMGLRLGSRLTAVRSLAADAGAPGKWEGLVYEVPRDEIVLVNGGESLSLRCGDADRPAEGGQQEAHCWDGWISSLVRRVTFAHSIRPVQISRSPSSERKADKGAIKRSVRSVRQARQTSAGEMERGEERTHGPWPAAAA